MKINCFTFEVRPYRDYFDNVRELRFKITEFGGTEVERIVVLDPTWFSDHKSVLDHIFDRTKQELENHIEVKP